MNINNTEDFENVLRFLFSSNYENLKKIEKDNVKKQVIIAIPKIKESFNAMKNIAEEELKESYIDVRDFNRLIFIIENLSEEEKINIITKYVINKEEIRGKQSLEVDVLLPMLDYLPDDKKVQILSKANSVELLSLMGKFNYRKRDSWRRKTRKYYENYYDICNEALNIPK